MADIFLKTNWGGYHVLADIFLETNWGGYHVLADIFLETNWGGYHVLADIFLAVIAIYRCVYTFNNLKSLEYKCMYMYA